jgi:hypothetical protein
MVLWNYMLKTIFKIKQEQQQQQQPIFSDYQKVLKF